MQITEAGLIVWLFGHATDGMILSIGFVHAGRRIRDLRALFVWHAPEHFTMQELNKC
jgi:hypothetical protein